MWHFYNATAITTATATTTTTAATTTATATTTTIATTTTTTTTTTTANSNYHVSMHKCLCLLVILMTTLSLVFKKNSVFLAIICYKSGLIISSCTIILFTCLFTQNKIIVVFITTIKIILG